MAALSDNIQVEEKDGIVVDSPAAVDIIYSGALVVHNADGYLAPCTGAEAGAKFAGVALEKVDNSGGSAGDKSCKHQTKGLYLLTGSSFAQADVGSPVYGSDDQTVTKTFAANLPKVGIIEKYVSSTQVWVQIDARSGDVGAAAITTVTGGATVDAEARTAINSVLVVLRQHRMIQG